MQCLHGRPVLMLDVFYKVVCHEAVQGEPAQCLKVAILYMIVMSHVPTICRNMQSISSVVVCSFMVTNNLMA